MQHKALTERLNEMDDLKQITTAFSEVAFRKIQSIRDSVESQREYMLYLENIFEEARIEHARIGRTKKGKQKLTFLAHNGKSVAVLFSANQGLFGSITSEVFAHFANFVRGRDVEVTIVGNIGVQAFKHAFPQRPFTQFSLPDSSFPGALIGPVVSHLAAYDQIDLFFGTFESVVSQKPASATISSQLPSNDTVAKRKERYFFEPTLVEVLRFFESEMFYSQLLTVSQESVLGKLGSRAKSMDQASEKIETEQKKFKNLIRKSYHREIEKKQHSQLSQYMFNN